MRFSRPPIPLNLFGIPFGRTGLAGLWSAMSSAADAPVLVSDALWVVAVAAWLVTMVRYLLGARTLRTVRADLRHPVFGPFAALTSIVATLIGERIHADLPAVGQVWVLVTATISFAFAAWFIANLATGAHEIDQLHSGYFLPTVAGGVISAQSLAVVGFQHLAIGALGTGLLFWLLLGAITLHRLAFRPQAPAAIMPTLAIFSAPPAVMGNAWFAITSDGEGSHIDTVQRILFGTFLFLIAFQVALIPVYRRIPFTLGFWALTFTATASARYAVQFVVHDSVIAAAVWQWAVALMATALTGAVVAASVRLVIRSRRLSVVRV